MQQSCQSMTGAKEHRKTPIFKGFYDESEV
jgi:hypothetical protein